MALTEHQISRYARHILLPEVGGIGQEKLLAAEVRISGDSCLVELAGDYLSAAGVRVDAHSGAGLELRLNDGNAVVLRADGADVRVIASPCPACRGCPAGPIEPVLGAIGASLAASECLRLILGIGAAARSWILGPGGALSTGAIESCPEHEASR